MLNNPRRLSELQCGDTVAVHTDRAVHPAQVARVTKTKMTLEDGTEWLTRNGHRYGSSHDQWYRGPWLEPWSEPEHRALMGEYQREALRFKAWRRLEGFGYRGLPDEALTKLLAILDQYAPKKPSEPTP